MYWFQNCSVLEMKDPEVLETEEEKEEEDEVEEENDEEVEEVRDLNEAEARRGLCVRERCDNTGHTEFTDTALVLLCLDPTTGVATPGVETPVWTPPLHPPLIQTVTDWDRVLCRPE